MFQEEAAYIQEITTADGQTVQHLVTADNQVRGHGPWVGDCPVGRAGSSGGEQGSTGRAEGTGVVETDTGDRPGPAVVMGVGSGDLFLDLNSHVCRFSTLLPRKVSRTCFHKSMLLSQRDITSR